MFAALAAVLAGAVVVATAQEKPAPAPAVQPKAVPAPAQPLPARPIAPASVAALEEEVETLEARRDVKKAYVKAAEVAVRANDKAYALIKGATAAAVELNKAEADFEMAKAQRDIRVAELKEVEVKIKHAKKRLEDAKAGGGRPAPETRPVEPKAADPTR
jgi:hypothetical protein